MVPVLRTSVHQVRALLQNTVRLLRPTRSSPKTYATQGYALIDHAQSRLAQAQSHKIQHSHKLCTFRVRQSRRISTRNASQTN
jgi:hypothetical protein